MVTGIIAEYNPFHNGHMYQIDYAKNILKADYIIVALSPDFTQRGEIACLSKYERTRIALELGVDMVIQIPINAATDSSSGYAYGGIKILESLGIVDTLLFSCENDNIELLSYIADIELNNNKDFLDNIADILKKGKSYPVARAEALTSLMTSNSTNSNNKLNSTITTYDVNELLNKPNNILSIEYIKAIKKLNSNIKPVCIKRVGADYNDVSIESDTSSDIASATASATAIRHAIYNNDIESITKVVPANAYEIYKYMYDKNMFIKPNDVSLMLGYKLLRCNLSDYKDLSKSMSNKISNELKSFSSYTEFIKQLKSKDVTYTRISRVLCHILLGITDDMYFEDDGRIYPCIPYIYILGINSHGEELLSMIKKSSTLPCFTSYVDALEYEWDKAYSEKSKLILNADINATKTSNLILANKTGKKVTSELSRKFLKV